MCPIRPEELRFDHLVVFEKDKTLFAAARYNAATVSGYFLSMNQAATYIHGTVGGFVGRDRWRRC